MIEMLFKLCLIISTCFSHQFQHILR